MTARRRLAVAVAAAALLLTSACAAQAPAALVRKTVPAAPTSDPAHPCTREAAAGAPGAAGGSVTATLDKASNTIRITEGKDVTLTTLSRAIGDDRALKEAATGEWLLGANLEIDKGASMLIQSPEVRWLKLSSGPTTFVTLKVAGGGLAIKGSCITSWDDAAQRASTGASTPATPDTAPDAADTAAAGQQGRSFVLARDGATMTIDHAELAYLGYGNRESYGLLWRTEGTTGHLVDSIVSHNYFGVYTFDVGGVEISGNDIFENTLYGIDPHTGSHDLKIINNTVHDNGKHGIILAEKCVNSVISGNMVYRNQHHGIVLYQNSDNNTVENNDSFGNASQGVNINESKNNTVVNNRIYDNLESGIGVADTGQDNTLRQNDIRGNKVDGIRLVTAATTTSVLSNVIGQNGRYGVYVDSDGPFTLTDNTIYSNKTGVQMKGTANPTTSGNSIFDNEDADIRNG